MRRLFSVLALACSTAPLTAWSCPDGECERCVPFVGCGCIWDAACRIIPALPSPVAVPYSPRLVITTAAQAAKDVTATIAKGVADTQATLVKAGSDASNAINKAGSDASNTINKAGSDASNTINKAGSDASNTINKAGSDASNAINKAGSDTGAEIGRVGHELGVAGNAIVHYFQNEAAGAGQAISDANRRLREGKTVDAIWHLSLAPIQVADKSASEAVLESDYLRGIGQVAANAYGGPAGAAGYSAWLAYHQSGGNASIALRAGILTGASAYAFQGAGKIDDAMKKTIVTAAIGGAAVAAAGGDQKAVQEAFLKAGAMAIVQDGYQTVTGHALDGKASQGEAYCITAEAVNCTPLPKDAIVGVDDKGNFIVDMHKVDPSVPAVGLKDHTAYFNESNAAMTSVSRVPGMQAMAVFHDEWAISWDMGPLATPATIVPAIVLTYVGTGAPYFDLLERTSVEQALFKNADPVPLAALTPPDKKPYAPRVMKSYHQVEGDRLVRSVLYEQAPAGAPLWCANPSDVPEPYAVKLPMFGMTSLMTCRAVENGVIKRAVASSSSFQCRVLTRRDAAWTLEEYSLTDREGCAAALQAALKAVPAGTTWLRGEAAR